MTGTLLYRRWDGSHTLKIVIGGCVYYVYPDTGTWEESMHKIEDIVDEPELFILIPEWV